MSSIRLATAQNVRGFQNLSHALLTTNNKWTDLINPEALEDEIGRFRVWSGNLGALQKGHSSLDYRLRDSPLLSSNALKFLQELADNLNEAFAVVSEARLPYEQQPKPERSGDEDDDDDDFFDKDEDDDDDDEDGSRTELSMRFADIVDIIDNLYKLSVRIRTPTIRSRSLKAATYNPKDSDSGVDILSAYANYDLQHTKELIDYLRQPHVGEAKDDNYEYLFARLSAAITLRRRQFKYWKRHRDKLGSSILLEEKLVVQQPVIGQPVPLQLDNVVEEQPRVPVTLMLKDAHSEKTGRTLLSGTEATQHYKSLDEIVDTKSVTSYAVTVKDLHGKGIQLPPPPRAADGERDFECPYCYIICPARYGRGRAWKTHLLQDLQPYICTYPDCDGAEQLFRSRREWSEHEASHRKAWRCPEHPTAVYKSEAGLEGHLRQEHLDSFPESQLPSIIKVGETTTVDVRSKCPICYVPADTEGLGDFHNHIANHLERFATFALPNAIDGNADGGSSMASRGRTENSNSQDTSGLPSQITDEADTTKEGFESFESERVEYSGHDHTRDVTPIGESETLLSVESLLQLPDASQNRLETLLANRGIETDDDNNATQWQTESGDVKEADLAISNPKACIYCNQDEDNDPSPEFEEYLVCIGCGNNAHRQCARDAATLNPGDGTVVFLHVPNFISSLFLDATHWQCSDCLQNNLHQKTAKDVPEDIDIKKQEVPETKTPILEISEIPTLRSLYRTHRLLQRNQSVAPNDSYNQIISFCYHDLTRLKVDAIVFGATEEEKMKAHQEQFSYMETKTRSKIYTDDQATITRRSGHASKYLIRVSRPGYSKSRDMRLFNQLVSSYRSAFEMAMEYELKTIAFPCIGTGGIGFPSGVAARIVLEEVRKFLDETPQHNFERIVFCVNTVANEKSYLDFFPAYFPPTHGDLESARSSVWSEDRAALAVQVLDTRNLVQKLFADLNTGLSLSVPDFPRDILKDLAAIDSSLASIRRYLLWSQELTKSFRDLKLTCTVMQLLCGNVSELIDLAKDHASLGQQSDKAIWDDYISDMKERHGNDLPQLLRTFCIFVECLDDIMTRNGVEIHAMAEMREQLERYKNKQRGGGNESIQGHFDEVLYTREFQREAIAHTRETVRLHQIQSIAQLYKMGKLEQKQTLAQPSAIFNHTVCLVREDITKLEVDLMVNSTDPTFGGMGVLDRTVFAKGGIEMRQAVKSFGICEEGDAKLTEGYLLPAKHVLHVVPPRQYGKNVKELLKKIYREALYTAVSLGVTSLAIPSIGTGMLNYPRRDCSSLAMDEVRRFLESADPSSLIEKIIFVVYSSNDEFIYKSLLPSYFPPLDVNVNRGLPASQPSTSGGSSKTSNAPRRTLYGSISEALRSRLSVNNLDVSRPLTTYEEHALIKFESHAKECDTCKDIEKLYLEGRDLCENGYARAQLVLWHMNMRSDQLVYTKLDDNGRSIKLEVPTELFPISLSLLTTIEKSYRDGDRTRPFVSSNRPYREIIQDQAQDVTSPDVAFADTEAHGPARRVPKKARARVFIKSKIADGWVELSSEECHIRVYMDRVDIYQHELDVVEDGRLPLLSLELELSTIVQRHMTVPEVTIEGTTRLQSGLQTYNMVMFRCRSDPECTSLLRMIRRALERHHDHARQLAQSQEATIDGTDQSIAEIQEKIKWYDSDAPPQPQLEPGYLMTSNLNGPNKWTCIDRNIVDPAVLKHDNIEFEDRSTDILLRRPLEASELVKWIMRTRDTKKLQEISKPPIEPQERSADDDVTRSRALREIEDDLSLIKNSRGGTAEDVMKRDQILGDIEDDLARAKETRKGSAEDERIPWHQRLGDIRDKLSSIKKAHSATSDDYIAWNQRLKDIREELSTAKKASGGPTDLQFKMERLSAATTSPSLDRQQHSEASELYDASRSLLKTKILVCLIADLKTRPGSYIGLRTEDIVSAIRSKHADVLSALDELVAEDEVHNTVDENTWVVTHPPEHLPPLAPQDQARGDLITPIQAGPGNDSNTQMQDINKNREAISIDTNASLLDVSNANRHISGTFISHEPQGSSPRAALETSHRDQSPLSNVAIWMLSYVSMERLAHPNLMNPMILAQIRGEFTIPESEIEPAMAEIRAKAWLNHSSKVPPLLKPGLVFIHNFKHLWTVISKELVGSRALTEVEVAFEERIDDMVIYRSLAKGELVQWVNRTRQIRDPHDSNLIDIPSTLEQHYTSSSLKAAVRNAPSFNDIPPSPTVEASSEPHHHTTSGATTPNFQTMNIDDFFSYPKPFGARWTRIDKRLVDAAVLSAADEEFDETDDSLIVHRVLRRGEIRNWAQASQGMRKHNDMVREAQNLQTHKTNTVPEQDTAADKQTSQKGVSDWDYIQKDLRALGAEARLAIEEIEHRRLKQDAIDDTLTETKLRLGEQERHRRAEREEQQRRSRLERRLTDEAAHAGKGKEREKDEQFDMLDRVIAGDVKEEEMRHFADRDDDRYT